MHRATAICLTVLLAACEQGLVQLDTAAEPGSAEPNLATTPSGAVVLSYLQPVADGIDLRYQVFSGEQWSRAQTIAGGKDWMINWADFPSVAPLSEDLWAAHWLVDHPGGKYAYDVSISLSKDGGRTWGAPITPHTDGTASEHGFVSLFARGDGVGAVWLDGRAMPEGTQLRTATLGTDGRLSDAGALDQLVCDCCQTDVAMTTSGPVVVYRDRSENEIRDIYAARLIGDKWTDSVPVAHDGWEITGCPVNGPAIDALGDEVAVAWYTAAPKRRVQLAFGDDSGFAEPIEVEAKLSLGRVDVVLVEPGVAVVSWLQRGKGRLAIRSVHADGTLGPIQEIAAMSVQRNAGFPKMARHEDGLVFAWTDTSGDQSQVRSAYLSRF